jgi:2-amino-4-hydroxy-6-hydroxymethyldihydropteridine diphosphokinase
VTDVVLLLGSNSGRRVKRLREGMEALSREIRAVRASRIYAGAPAGRRGQPWFLNVALRGRTALSPEDLLVFVKGVEAAAGRKAGPRWGPRELDIDIILAGDREVRAPHLEIPHPRMASRRFCLLPVCEVAPELAVPPGGRTIRDLLLACEDPIEVFAI